MEIVNTRTITAALVAFTMIVMATSPLIDNTNELRPNGIVEFDQGGSGVANGTATLGGILTWQDDAWNSTWNCSGGLALVTPSDWSNFVASGENDPYNYTSWGINLTGAGSYYTEYAPAGEWVVTAGLGCMDDAGEPRSAGGQYGDVHENPPTVNLTNGSTVGDVSFTLIEYSEEDYPTFVCGDGEEIPFDWVNDGYEDCADGSDEPQDYDGDGVTDNWFNCMDGTNISMDLVNDGNDDCLDGDDEAPDFMSIEDLMAMLDADGDGNLSLEELIDFVNAEENDETGENMSQEDEDMLTDAFNESDEDGNGLLDLDELEYLINMLDEGDDEHTFVCGNGEEIPFEWVNDGYEDCTDGSDEPQDFDGDGVTDNWFDCHDGTNISMDLVNDGNNDCPDGEDESPSDGDYFTCNDGEEIPFDWVNDGYEDCADGEDEDGGGGDYFTCYDGSTIPNEWVNDGDEDCPDGEDENGSGGEITFVCGDGEEIPFNWVNDGEEDCSDGSDEPQDFDGDGVTDNWFNCHDGTNISMDLVNDNEYNCPEGDDEGVLEAEDDMDCAESGLQMSLHYDAAGDIYFEMTMECAFSQEDSDDMRAMYDLYFGDGDGILNESEAAILIEMMTENDTSEETSEACEEWEYWNPELINESLPGNGCPEYVEDSDGDDGNWTIDGISVEMTDDDGGTWDNLADPSVPISISMIMTTDSIADDGTGTHTVMFVSNPDDVDDGDDSEECSTGSIVSNSDFAPISVVFTPATQWTIGDMGNYFDFNENPSATGECNADGPGSATIVFESVEEVVVEPVDTEPTCAYSWTVATDTSWESESGITMGPDGDVNMTFVAGSYMIAVQCSDAENDVVNASWATADGTLSASETGSGTVFGWVQFTIPEGITGTMEVEYAWDSTTFGSAGTFTFNFVSNETAEPGATPVGTGGGIPGFTSVLTVSALLGAAMILARRKD
ncbi:MAG: hypothetical protein CXT69_04595 [Methanobacteriota archaeon]|nr:MAG: hypothetical protein CXT69_04595 [Euryarchaeota archaeon]